MNDMVSGTRILVIDDERDVLYLLTERLTSWGCAVLTAESGEDGWRLTKEHRPDLILLDVIMPKMKGRAFCELLKADPRTKDIPVIFVTALELPAYIKAGFDAGAEDYIVKPFTPEELRNRIEGCLARHQNR